MGRYRKKTSTLLTTLVYGLGKKQHPATISLSESLGSPVLQTSLICKLPDELILSILSHIAPDTQYTDHWVRFRILHHLKFKGSHEERVQFLRPLSMTCKIMRFRLVPWIWERLEFLSAYCWGSGGNILAREFSTIANAFHMDVFLATSVKFVTVDFAWHRSNFPSFVKCLESLPNLHTLEIERIGDSDTTALKCALRGVKLPQIRTLILPSAAYPLLQRCRNVEDIVCVAGDQDISPDEFLGSLPSKRDSKVRRLAIPLVTWANPSRFVVVCPRLTELTVIFPHLTWARGMEGNFLSDQAERACYAISDLMDACKALPDFDTFQIARFPIIPPRIICQCRWPYTNCYCFPPERSERALEKNMRSLEEWVIDCLKWPRNGEAGGRKRTTFRTIRFGSSFPSRSSVEIYEYGVEEFGGGDP